VGVGGLFGVFGVEGFSNEFKVGVVLGGVGMVFFGGWIFTWFF